MPDRVLPDGSGKMRMYRAFRDENILAGDRPGFVVGGMAIHGTAPRGVPGPAGDGARPTAARKSDRVRRRRAGHRRAVDDVGPGQQPESPSRIHKQCLKPCCLVHSSGQVHTRTANQPCRFVRPARDLIRSGAGRRVVVREQSKPSAVACAVRVSGFRRPFPAMGSLRLLHARLENPVGRLERGAAGFSLGPCFPTTSSQSSPCTGSA